MYSGQVDSRVIAHLRLRNSNNANPAIIRVLIHLSTFVHIEKHFIDQLTNQVDTQKLFLFVKVLLDPDEVYETDLNKFRFFKVFSNSIEHEVIIELKDIKKNIYRVLTHFENDLKDKRDQKYSERQKNTSKKVFLILEGRSHYPSSNMLSQVPGIGSRLPRSSELSTNVPKTSSIVKLDSGREGL